jgi:membrane-associated phospholipid phosphatase
MPLTPFVYSFIEYEQGDPLGFLFALSGLAPLFVLSALATLLASRRDLHTLVLLLGQLLNEALNHALKYAARVPRPSASAEAHAAFNAQSPYAWPSDHAQFMAFLACYVLLWAPRHWHVGAVWKALACGLCGLGAAVVGAGRVYLGYHTLLQVLCGWGVGAAAAAAHFALVERVLRPRFAAVAGWQLARWALVRDLTATRNVLKAEYDCVARSKGVLLF